MEKKKGLPHFICERAPVIGMLLAFFIDSVFLMIPEYFRDRALGGNETYVYLADIAVSILFMFLFTLWFSPSYRGSVRAGVSGKEIMLILIPILVYTIVNIIILILQGALVFEPAAAKLVQALNAGFSEEVLFRVTMIPIALHFMKSDKKVTLAWLIPAVIFGAAHMGNLTGGGALSVIIAQAVATSFFGIYFAALFMCTGSIAVPIAVHAVWDLICFTCDGKLNHGMMVQQSVDSGLLAECATNIALGIIAVMMIYRNREKIISIWDKKWSGR